MGLLEGVRASEKRIAELEALLEEKEIVVTSLEGEKNSKVREWEQKAKALYARGCQSPG